MEEVMQIKINKALKWVLSISILVIGIVVLIRYSSIKLPFKTSNSSKPIEQTNAQKKQHWQSMEKEVDSWKDALGLGIDTGIKNTVIVLNLLGFKTSASCQGHIDWGLPYPWIDFAMEDNEINTLNNERQAIYKRVVEKESEIQKKHPNLSLAEALRKEESEELNMMYQKMHTINNKIEIASKTKLIPLKNLISDFYKTHSVDSDVMIIIYEINPTFLRMHSLGGNWQIVRDNNEKVKKLKEYQQEMNLFTTFLTNYYFSK
jgi:hypothetical protein